MCYFDLWAQGCGCFEQLNIIDDMNDLRAHELRLLEAMSSLGLLMIWMILHQELKVVDDMNNYRSWAHDSRYYEKLMVVVDMTQGGELKTLDVMSNSKLWMIWTT